MNATEGATSSIANVQKRTPTNEKRLRIARMDSRQTGGRLASRWGVGKACLMNSARELATLERCQVLAFALKDALHGGCLYQHLALLAAGRMVGVGEFEQFNGRAVFDDERDADAIGWAVGRNQNFAAGKLGGEISHFKRDVRNLPDEIRDRRVRFETHPLHAKFAFLVADDKELQVFQVGLARLRFSSRNSDVMVPAHCFLLSVEFVQIVYGYRSAAMASRRAKEYI